jgi:hypothetical protein
MSQKTTGKKMIVHTLKARCLAAFFIALLLTSSLTRAQSPVNLYREDWRVFLGKHAAVLMLRYAKRPPAQDNSTQQVWKASKDSTAKSAPAQAKVVWSASKGATINNTNAASDEQSVEANAAANKAVIAPTVDPAVPAQEAEPGLNPLALLASSRTIYVQSHSIYVKRKSIEDALMKKKGFLEMGYAIVKDLAQADMKLEVDHTPLTLRYPYTVTHMKTQVVVATGTVHSLRILNDVPGDTADSFVQQARAARGTGNKPKN